MYMEILSYFQTLLAVSKNRIVKTGGGKARFLRIFFHFYQNIRGHIPEDNDILRINTVL